MTSRKKSSLQKVAKRSKKIASVNHVTINFVSNVTNVAPPVKNGYDFSTFFNMVISVIKLITFW